MKICNQVCTVEQAKRLKELGVCQDSYFLYGDKIDGPTESWIFEGDEDVFYAAFTVAELGAMLSNASYAVYYRLDNIWYWHADFEMTPFGAFKIEAEARAAVLIYMLENKILLVMEVNQRLQDA